MDFGRSKYYFDIEYIYKLNIFVLNMTVFDNGYDDGYPDDSIDWKKDGESWKYGSDGYLEHKLEGCEDKEGEEFNRAFNKPINNIYFFDPLDYSKVMDVLRGKSLGIDSIASVLDPCEIYSVSLKAMLDFLVFDKVVSGRMINSNGLDRIFYELRI